MEGIFCSLQGMTFLPSGKQPTIKITATITAWSTSPITAATARTTLPLNLENKFPQSSSYNALTSLNSSLAQSSRVQSGANHESRLAACVMAASRFASAIVQKYSDFHVALSQGDSISSGNNEPTIKITAKQQQQRHYQQQPEQQHQQ